MRKPSQRISPSPSASGGCNSSRQLAALHRPHASRPASRQPSRSGRPARRGGLDLLEQELDNIGSSLVEGGFAVGEIHLPDAHEMLVKALSGDLLALGAALAVPAPQRFGVVAAEGVALQRPQAFAPACRSKRSMLGSMPPGKMYCWMKSVLL